MDEDGDDAVEETEDVVVLFVVEDSMDAPIATAAMTMITITTITAAIVEIERFVEKSLLLCMRHATIHALFKSCDHLSRA